MSVRTGLHAGQAELFLLAGQPGVSDTSQLYNVELQQKNQQTSGTVTPIAGVLHLTSDADQSMIRKFGQ